MLAIFVWCGFISTAQIQSEGCYDSQGNFKPCGSTWSEVKDGVPMTCYCNCALTPPYDCSPTDGNNSNSYSSSAPSQQELNDYYNGQWSGYLFEQADKEFKKGLEDYNNHDCKSAAQHFKKAMTFMDNNIYTEYYNAALQCDNKPTQNTTTPSNTNNTTNTNTTTPPQNSTPSNTTTPTTSVGGRDRLMNSLYEQKLAETETANMKSGGLTWVEYQKQQFSIRINQPNYWCKAYYDSLIKMDSSKSLSSSFPYKKQSQLEVGDVILIGPVDGFFSSKQANLDAWLNDNNAYVTHTVTCVKIIDGHKLFLDNQSTQGPRIISEDEFNKLYGSRDASVVQMRGTIWGVAQPLNSTEANQLWTTARDMVEKNKLNTDGLFTNYGLYGNNDMVCSESSWALLNATGRYSIPFDKHIPLATGVDFSPASFYNFQQYFLITPLGLGQ